MILKLFWPKSIFPLAFRNHQNKTKQKQTSDYDSFLELFHLITIYIVWIWPKEWRSREGERRNLAEMDTSALPGRFPGPQQGRGKHWIGWIWHGADTWLTWTCETQRNRDPGRGSLCWCLGDIWRSFWQWGRNLSIFSLLGRNRHVTWASLRILPELAPEGIRAEIQVVLTDNNTRGTSTR